MKKIDNRIYKYLSGLMEEAELAKFRDELNSSKELKIQLEHVKHILSSAKENSTQDADQRYFAGLIPRFRKARERRSGRVEFRMALSFVTTVLILFFIVRGLTPSNTNIFIGLQNISGELDSLDLQTNESVVEIIDDQMLFLYPDYISSVMDEYLQEQYDQETQFAVLNANLISSVIDEVDFDESISQDDLDLFYDEIKNLKF